MPKIATRPWKMDETHVHKNHLQVQSFNTMSYDSTGLKSKTNEIHFLTCNADSFEQSCAVDPCCLYPYQRFTF